MHNETFRKSIFVRIGVVRRVKYDTIIARKGNTRDLDKQDAEGRHSLTEKPNYKSASVCGIARVI